MKKIKRDEKSEIKIHFFVLLDNMSAQIYAACPSCAKCLKQIYDRKKLLHLKLTLKGNSSRSYLSLIRKNKGDTPLNHKLMVSVLDITNKMNALECIQIYDGSN